MSNDLRARCAEYIRKQSRDAILRQGNPVEDLVEFVIAETGRAMAGSTLDDSYPVCAYFETRDDRDEFVALALGTRASWRVKKTI